MRDVDGCFPFWISLSDKFGDNGLILVAICRLSGETLDIESFLMSCRVLQRGVEQLAMNTIIDVARRRGLARVTGRYVPTARNSMVKDFYRHFGFETTAERPDGGSEFEIALGDYLPTTVRIEVIDSETSEIGLHA
jgi:predicted enzyme involved in methoxymalonyl-ACP biosynthesis